MKVKVSENGQVWISDCLAFILHYCLFSLGTYNYINLSMIMINYLGTQSVVELEQCKMWLCGDFCSL